MPKKATTKTKAPKTTGEAVKDETLEAVKKDFNSSWKYCAGSWHDRWTNNYKLYHNNRVKKGYVGITDTFVPMVFGTVETLTSALFGAKPKFNFMPPHEREDQNTDILNALVDFYWDKDQWSVKVVDTGREMLQLGTSVDYFCWYNDHPMMIHIPLRDFFIDPLCTTIENARYMGRRYLTTIDELESFEVIDLDNPIEIPGQPMIDEMTGEPQIDEMTGELVMDEPEVTYQMKKKYKNLDKLKNASDSTGKAANETVPSDEKTDKQEKDDLYGSTLEDVEGQVEVLEYWTLDKVVSVVNRRVVIEESVNYYKAKAEANGDQYPKGLMPFAACRDFVDPSLFYATSEIDVIADQQELLNDLTNQRIDAVTYVLNPMYTLDPTYSDKIEEVENIPGAVYPFAKDTLNRIDMGTVSPDAFNETMNIKNDMREVTAVNEVVKGAGDTASGNTTATEINAQIAGAGQRINLKITQLENEYFHRVARILFAMIKLYVTEPMMVRIVGRDGAKWEEFDPTDFTGEYEPRVQLDIAIQNKKEEQAAMAKEMLAAFLNDPDINQQELKKLVLARSFDLEPDEVQGLIQENPMAGMIDPMTGMPMQPPMGGAPPPQGAPVAPPPEDIAQPTLGGGLTPPAQDALPPELMAELAGVM